MPYKVECKVKTDVCDRWANAVTKDCDNIHEAILFRNKKILEFKLSDIEYDIKVYDIIGTLVA